MNATTYDLPNYVYIGDVHIAQGGIFINPGVDEYEGNILVNMQRYNAGDVVEVISTADYDGNETLVISGSVYLSRSLKGWRSAFRCCDIHLAGLDRRARRVEGIYAMHSYFGMDTAQEDSIPEDIEDEEAAIFAAVERVAL